MSPKLKSGALAVLTLFGASSLAQAQTAESAEAQRIAQLEKMVQQLMQEVQTLKKDQNTAKPAASATVASAPAANGNQELLTAQEVANLKEIVRSYEENPDAFEGGPSWYDKLTLGGYGEIQYQFANNSTKDHADLHRLVMFAQYDFEEWLRFVGEFELEHGSTDEAYVIAEQAYVEADLTDNLSLRVGRVLAPMGYVNANHEPSLFNGVERPTFYKYVIPSTWFVDGAGIVGSINEHITYEAYVVNGMDGSEFDYKGIRGGRQKGRPGLNDIAFTGRVDIHPFVGKQMPYNQKLRLGFSTYAGGIDNVNKGGSNGLSGDVFVGAFDYQYSIGRFDLRGAIAATHISSAEEMASQNVAEEMLGWYQEVAFHAMPDSWKDGKLANSDLVLFARYDWFDNQREMPTGVTADPRGEYKELTLGASFHVTPQFVVKADYQMREDEADSDLADLINVGVGFNF